MRAIGPHLGAVLGALTLLLCIASAPQARADDSVVVQVSPKMYLGDTGRLTIVVRDAQGVQPPKIEGGSDFQAVYQGSGQSSRITMGAGGAQVLINAELIYAFTPKHTGMIDVPAIDVTVGGRVHRTTPVRVEVVEPTAATGFKLDVTVDRTEAYVGQPILLKLEWTVGKSAANVSMTMPIEGVEHDLFPGPVSRNPANGNQVLSFNGEQVGGLYQNGVLTLDRVLIPSAPGKITIGPSRVDFAVVLADRPGGQVLPWDPTERSYSGAPAITIDVRPLPKEGRPANFSGLVGNYTIAAAADAKTVSVGEPINLNLVVTGPFPLTLVPPLDLRKQSMLAKDFRVPREPILPQVSVQVASFQAMLRARSPEVKEIGPVSLTYFDPDAKQYKTARTGAIPITVTGTNTVTLPDEPEPPASSAAQPENRPGGLPDIDRNAVQESAAPLDLTDELGSWRTIAILAAPPGLCGVALVGLGLRRWGERDPAMKRRRRAYREFRRAMGRAPRGSAVDSLAHALTNFAADLFDEPRDALTAPRVAELLRGLESPAGAELAEIAMACDRARFGLEPSEMQAKEMSDRAVRAARACVSGRTARAPRLVVSVLLATSVALLAARSAAAQQTSSGGTAQAATPQALFDRGVKLLANDPAGARAALARAGDAFEAALARPLSASSRARVLYNAGVSRQLAGDLGRAVLDFRRAQLVDPSVPGLREHLSAARGAVTGDAAAAPERGETLVRVAIDDGVLSIPSVWLWRVAGGGYAAFWALALLRIVVPWGRWRPHAAWLVLCGVVAVAPAALLGVHIERERRAEHEAVVLGDVVARTEPDDLVGAPAGGAPLKAGAELVVEDMRAGANGQEWARVRRRGPVAEAADVGWVPATSLGVVSPGYHWK